MAILAELGFAEFAVLQIGQDARNYVDVTASAVLALPSAAFGQAVANVTALASAGQASDNRPQAVNNTTAEAVLSVLQDWSTTEAFLASAGGTLRMAPLTSSGVGLTATASATWMLASNIQPLLDGGFDGLWQLVTDFYTSVFAHAVASGNALAIAAAQSNSILLTKGAAFLSLAGKLDAVSVSQTFSQGFLRGSAQGTAQSLALSTMSADLMASGEAKATAALHARFNRQLLLVGIAFGNPFSFSHGEVVADVQMVAQGYTSVIAHSRASAPWRVSANAIAHTAAIGTATGLLRLNASAERGTNRLNFMPQGYATTARPYENRTSNRPAEAREAVST